MARGEYTAQHRRSVNRKIAFPIKRAEKGMIFEVFYTDKTGRTSSYYILILNRWYKFPGESVFKVHALKLDVFPMKLLNDMALKYGIKYIPNVQRYRKLDIPKLIQDASSKRIYDNRIKKLMFQYPCYRTMFQDEFKMSFLIDYKFNKKIEKKFLLESAEEQQSGGKKGVDDGSD